MGTNDFLSIREPIVEKCKGCRHTEGNYCNAYAFPFSKWRIGDCPLASHILPKTIQREAFVDPLKKSKKKAKGIK